MARRRRRLPAPHQEQEVPAALSPNAPPARQVDRAHTEAAVQDQISAVTGRVRRRVSLIAPG